MNQSKITALVLGILLLGGLFVRFYKIDNPVADWHSWRQADTSAVTRNFFRFGLNPFYPRYDDFSDVSGRGLQNPEGYRFVEFPLFNIFHFLLAKTFPFRDLEFWGRMTSILAGLASASLLFFVVRRHTSVYTGLMSAFFYLFLPYNIYFTRVILPDPLMVTLYLASLNFFDLYNRKPKNLHLLLGIIFGALAVMVKPVAVFFLLPVTWQFFRKLGLGIFKNKTFYLVHLMFIIPYLLWRVWETRFPMGIPAGIWLMNGDGIRFKGAFFRWIFGERIGKMFLGSWGIFPLVAGIINGPGYLITWVLSALLYLIVFATGNVRHDYYQIPIMPAISVALAMGTSFLWRTENKTSKTLVKRTILVISILFMLAFSWYDIRGNFQVNHWEIVHAGQRLDQLVPKDAIVVAPYNGDTAFLYQTKRRGFAYIPFPIKDLIDRYNATYYVSVNLDAQTKTIMEKYIVVEQTPEFVIVKLEEPLKPK